MDNELKDILVKLLEGQDRLETKVTGIETKVAGLETKVTGIETKVTGLEKEVSGVGAKVSRLEIEVNKNSVKLESIEKKIEIIAEVQTAHKEQNERDFKRAREEQSNINILATNSLKTISNDVVEVKKDINELKEKFDKVEKVTIQNTYDVAYLKSVK